MMKSDRVDVSSLKSDFGSAQCTFSSGDMSSSSTPELLSLKWNQIHPIGAGLQNLGNTCFLNAALQCLTYTAPLATYMLSGEHSKTCHEAGCMMCTMQHHISLAFTNSGNVIKPIGVLDVLKRIVAHFHLGSQEDAHEFLGYIVEAMQESCSLKSMLDGHTETTNLIHQIFRGCLRSRVTCLTCKTISDTLEPCMDIALPINNSPSITGALENFIRPELLDCYNCSKCMKLVRASKCITIHCSSNVLMIAVMRFADFSGRKSTKVVRYPEQLDLRPYMSEHHGEPQNYRLYAVLVHSGHVCYTGHYYCYVKSSNGQWYKMNDSAVTESNIRTVLNQQAYLLFYIRSSDQSVSPDQAPQRCSANGFHDTCPSCFHPQPRKRRCSDKQETLDDHTAKKPKRSRKKKKKKRKRKDKHRLGPQ